MAIKEVEIELKGEQGSGKSQLMNYLKEVLPKYPQVLRVRDKQNIKKHALVVTFETDPEGVAFK